MVGKYSYANDVVQHGNDAHLAAKHIGKMQTFKFASIQKDPAVFSTSSPKGGKQFIASFELEDEDIAFRRKMVLMINYFIVAGFASFIIFFLSYLKRRLYNYRQMFTVNSDKYILQGAALRIWYFPASVALKSNLAYLCL